MFFDCLLYHSLWLWLFMGIKKRKMVECEVFEMFHVIRELTEEEKKDLLSELYHAIRDEVRDKDVAMLYNIYAARHNKPQLLTCSVDELINKDDCESIEEILDHLASGFDYTHKYKMEKSKGAFSSANFADDLIGSELFDVTLWLFNTEKMDDHHIAELRNIMKKYEVKEE